MVACATFKAHQQLQQQLQLLSSKQQGPGLCGSTHHKDRCFQGAPLVPKVQLQHLRVRNAGPAVGGDSGMGQPWARQIAGGLSLQKQRGSL